MSLTAIRCCRLAEHQSRARCTSPHRDPRMVQTPDFLPCKGLPALVLALSARPDSTLASAQVWSHSLRLLASSLTSDSAFLPRPGKKGCAREGCELAAAPAAAATSHYGLGFGAGGLRKEGSGAARKEGDCKHGSKMRLGPRVWRRPRPSW
jgi:hypothetical protein